MNRSISALLCAVDAEPDAPLAGRLAASLRAYRLPKGAADGAAAVAIEEDCALSPFDDAVRARLDACAFLILICSPRAKDCRALTERLDYMAARGRRGDVIAVLADGEPADAFPPFFIQRREAERMLPDGRIERYTETVEPVASDLRAASDREAKRRLDYETVRIMATLIGVPPDALERRHERRRRRRLRAVLLASLSVGLAVSGVFSYLGWRAASEGRIAAMQAQAGAEMVNGLFAELPERFGSVDGALPYVQDVMLGGIEGLIGEGSENIGLIDLNAALSIASGDTADAALRKAALWRRAGEAERARAAYREAISMTPLDRALADALLDAADRLVDGGWPGYALYVFDAGGAPMAAGSVILRLDGERIGGYRDIAAWLGAAVPGATIAVGLDGTDEDLVLTREQLAGAAMAVI